MLQKAPMYAYIPTKDVARARRFYEEKLGFKPKEETADGVEPLLHVLLYNYLLRVGA